MLNDKMYELGASKSVIRKLHELSEEKKAALGSENVFDFTIGNPSAPPPAELREKIISSLNDRGVHNYTAEQGDYEVRTAIARNIIERFNASVSADLIYMTCGAAAALSISLKAVVEEGDEVILLAPFFPEYKIYAENAGAKVVVVPFNENFHIDMDAFERALSDRTKAVIINSPNNPSGVIYPKRTIIMLSQLLKAKELQLGRQIFLISDEPYRELAYGEKVPYTANYYDDTLTCYSFSKSLSLPGERIGYICVNPNMAHAKDIFCCICGAGRALGYICAPSLFQKAVGACLDKAPDLSVYKLNRDIMYSALKRIGFECAPPDGAFYIMIKALGNDSEKFALRAAELGLLMIPCDDFGAPGYERIAYCVPTETIQKSIPVFEKLFGSYHQ